MSMCVCVCLWRVHVGVHVHVRGRVLLSRKHPRVPRTHPPHGSPRPPSQVLSSRKYPAYAAYQQRVSRFVPLPPMPKDHHPQPLTLADKLLVGWFVIGILITYLIDMEQVTTTMSMFVPMSLGS